MSYIDPLEKEASVENKETIEYIVKKIIGGSELSLLDLVPTFKDALKDTNFGYWSPPHEIRELKNPARRILTPLTSVFSPEVLLVPIFYNISSKDQFAGLYGLNEDYGLLYDDFLDLVKIGRIRLFIPSPYSSYTSSFYQEIFKICSECEQGGYRPPQYQTSFSLASILANLKGELGLDLNRKTLTETLGRDEFHISYWQEKAKILLKTNNSYLSQPEIKIYSRSIGTDAAELYFSGFKNLVDFLFERLSRRPELLQRSLRYYALYLIDGYSYGLGGLRFYTQIDVERMDFYRLMPKKEHEELQKLIESSPAAVTVISDPTDSYIVSKPSNTEMREALKKDRDSEMREEISRMQKSIHDVDLKELRTRSERIDEIVSERINKETCENFRDSKLIESTVRLGGTLGVGLALDIASTFLTAGTIPPGTFTVLGTALEKMVFEKQLSRSGKFLAKKWVFREKGLPSVIWETSQDKKS